MAKIGVEIDVTANAGDAAAKIGNLETLLKSAGKAAEQATLAGNSDKAREYGHLQQQVKTQYREEMSISRQVDTSYNRANTEADQATKRYEAATKAAEEAAQKAEELAAKKAEAEQKAAAATEAAEHARTAAIEAAERARAAATEEAAGAAIQAAEKAAQAAEAEAARKEQAAQKAAEAVKKAEAEAEKAATQTTDLANAALEAAEEAEAKKLALVEAAEAKKTALEEQAARIKQFALDTHERKSTLDQADIGEDREEKLKREQQLRLLRGMNRTLGLGSNAIGQAGSGNVAGGALDAAGGIADLVSALPKGALIGAAVVGGLAALAAGANKLSEQWEKVMQPSMALTASLGRLSDDADKNHATFQEVFAQATSRKALHGYKLEEGLALANQLAKMGVNPDKVISSEEKVFRYQRTTDADRNTLAQAVGLSQRYRGGEDVLGYALGGLKESGMQPGQYQEYLNATLRIFEEGLSRGVVKGFSEITRTQNMLAQLGSTWQGERGAEKIQRMEDAISGAGKLQSDYDVVMYRAAQQMSEANGGKGDYLSVTKILDQGLEAGNGKILEYIHKIVEGMVGKDDRGNVNRNSGVMQYMKMFSLNTEAAEKLWDGLAEGKLGNAKAILEDPKSRGVDDTPEGKLLAATEEIRKNVALWGADITPLKAAIVDGLAKLTSAMTGSRVLQSYKESNRDVLSNLGFMGNSLETWNQLFMQTYEDSDSQVDRNDNAIGDSAENAARAQRSMQMLSPEQQLRIGFDPVAHNRMMALFGEEGDFADDNKVNRFIQYLENIPGYADMQKDTARGIGLGSAFNDALERNNPLALAYAKSVKARYGSFIAFAQSDERKNAENYIGWHGNDGLTDKEVQEMIRHIMSSQGLSNIQESMAKTRYVESIKPFIQNTESSDYKELLSITEGNYPQLTHEKLAEIILPRMGYDTPGGMGITSDELKEIIQALRDLIPALSDASTLTFEIGG